MEEGGYDMATVERKGKFWGYMGNEGPVKVLEHKQWKLKKNETWMQAPRVCPGEPTQLDLTVGGPPEAVQAEMKHYINLMTEGKLELEINGTRKVVENRCLFLTRDCAKLNLTLGGPQTMRKLGMKQKQFEKLRMKTLINLKPRMLGSCALVANSDNLLKGSRGAEIDAHDTIFRHNTPITGFEHAVGSRPSSVLWLRAEYMKKDYGKAELMYDLLVSVENLPPTLKYEGKPLMIVNKPGGSQLYAKERARWYKLAGGTRRRHPSGGFAKALQLLASGLCTRVDMYGFSSKMTSGKYWDKGAKVLKAHFIHLEHWVHRYLMSQGKVCVYGD